MLFPLATAKPWKGFLAFPSNIPKPIAGCYLLLNVINEMTYVGVSLNVNARIVSGHRRLNSAELLRHAMVAHGMQSFLVVPLFYAPDRPTKASPQATEWIEDLLAIESGLIAEYRSLWPRGYNTIAKSGIGALSFSTRQKISAATRVAMDAPEVREKVLAHLLDPDFRTTTAEATRAYHAQEEVRAAYSARMADPEMQVRLVTPEREANRLAGLRAARATEESRARTSEASTRMWEDPAYRAHQEELRADPATRERMSRVTAERFTDPAERAKTSAATRAALADPEVKLRTAAAARLRWANPDYREKMRQSRLARQSAQ